MISLRKELYRLLRKSESLFRVDMVYLTKGGLWTTLRFGAGILASLATMLAFGNLVSKETYGTYNYLLSIAGTFGFLTLAGMGTGVIRSVARGFENVMPYALITQLKYNLLAVAGIGVAALYYGFKGNDQFAISLALLAIATPIAAAYHIYEAALIGLKRFDMLAIVTSATALLAAGATVITLFFSSNPVVLVAVYSFTAVVPNIIVYHYVHRLLPKTQPSLETISELRRTAFHLTGAGFVSTLAQYIDKIVLFQVAGPSTLAVYGFAIAGPERLKGLAKNWTSIALPRFAEKTLSDIKDSFYWKIIISLAVGIILAGIYIAISPFLFKLFLPRYLDSIIYSQFYALTLITAPATTLIGYIFYGQNMLRAVYISSVGTKVLKIVMFLVLGWQWQITGLIVASILSSIADLSYNIVVWEIERRRLAKING
jgi:O-antigen/teichoic acid export membrane protein